MSGPPLSVGVNNLSLPSGSTEAEDHHHSSSTDYGTTSDIPSVTLDNASPTPGVIESIYALPGGVLLTKRSAGNVWSYPNIHGDMAATATQAGAKIGATVNYDPNGALIAGSNPDNLNSSMDYGWLGQHQRPTELRSELQATIEMGARQYSPILGRFLEVDPVEGGSCNDYDYVCASPVDGRDLDGRKRCTRSQASQAKYWAGITSSGWSCNVYTSKWLSLKRTQGREVCPWTAPAYVCSKRLYNQERWQDFTLSRSGNNVVVSNRQTRSRMRSCVNSVGPTYSHCWEWWSSNKNSAQVYRR